jgi:hypothetical protein
MRKKTREYKNLWVKQKHDPGLRQSSWALRSWVDGPFGLPASKAHFKSANVLNIYLLQITSVWKSAVQDVAWAFVTRSDSPYFPMLQVVLNRMLETGQISGLSNKHSLQEPNCIPLNAKDSPMSLKKVASVFMFMGFVCLACGVIMGVEVIHNRLNPNENYRIITTFLEDPNNKENNNIDKLLGQLGNLVIDDISDKIVFDKINTMLNEVKHD